MDTQVGDLTQTGKRLRVITYRGATESGFEGDPFLLTNVSGSEGISTPFQFRLDMHRDLHMPYIPPSALVNTLVHFGVRNRDLPYNQEDFADYTYRTGVIAQADRRYLSQTVKSNVLLYSVVVVPAFKMLDLEVVYRVFENMDVGQILHEILDGYPNLNVSFTGIAAANFPKLPYCVQFGESTFNFASRLMKQFGIWYYFDNGDSRRAPDPPAASNGRMVLGRSNPPSAACGYPDLKVQNLKEDDDLDDTDTVAKCVEHVIPVPEWIRVGDFNQVDPSAPFSQAASIVQGLDFLSKNTPSEDQSRFKSEQFGKPFWTDPDTEPYARNEMSAAESGIWTMTGATKNATLVAGRLANLLPRDDDRPDTERRSILINHLEISAYEWGYEFNAGTNLWLGFRNLVKPIVSSKGFADFTANMASAGLGNWLQNQFPYMMQSSWDPASNPNVPDAGPYVLGGIAAAAAGLIPAIVTSIENVAKSEGDDYSNAFQSIYWDNPSSKYVPLPVGTKPVAQGPHLATVIGQKGTQSGVSTEVYADGLGRVRVRFPWQRSVPKGKGSGEQETDPLKSDRRTCWVRISQGWSGQGFGWQFLPRIGEEVIVAFLNGDPDQPIIVGRVYNADAGVSNLPFPAGQVNAEIYGIEDWLKPAPSNNFRFSGLKTCNVTTSKNDSSRYHLLRFDDTADDEQLLVRSQGRLDVTSTGSSYQTTEGDRHVLCIAGKDQFGNYVGGSLHTTTGMPYFGKEPSGEYTLHVGGNRREQVDLKYQLKVLKKVELDLMDDCSGVIAGTLSLSASTIVLQASQNITLKVGPHSLVVNGSGVWSDVDVKHNSGGPALKADSVTILPIADAAQADPGNPANKRATSSGGSGSSAGSGTPGGSNANNGASQSNQSSQSATTAPLSAPNYAADGNNAISCPLDELCGGDGGAG